jgi:allantoinase
VKRRAAAGAPLGCDVAFWGGIVPGNLDQVAGLAAAGVRGFKCFLADSGVPEFPPIEFDDLVPAMEATAAVRLPLLVHAESPAVLASAPPPGRTHASWAASRPERAETEAIAAVIAAAARTGARAHILHLSAAAALPLISRARDAGVAVTVETCPHYLTLTTEESGDDLAAKCAPPIRDAANRDRLWEGLASGELDMVVSDHSPCPGELKEGGFDRAWGGIASVELRLPLVWTEARRRGIDLPAISRWLSAEPARLAGIATGEILPGNRADLVVWDPEATFAVQPGLLAQRHPITPYRGWRLQGEVLATIVRGGSRPGLLPEGS